MNSECYLAKRKKKKTPKTIDPLVDQKRMILGWLMALHHLSTVSMHTSR
jgi:hypothetical protein